MMLTEATRRYGLHARLVRRMIDYGWTVGDVLFKLDATRNGRNWDVTEESLARWAAAYDTHMLAVYSKWMEDGPAFGVPEWGGPPAYQWCGLDRLVANGKLHTVTTRCESSAIPGRPDTGVRWHWYARTSEALPVPACSLS